MATVFRCGFSSSRNSLKIFSSAFRATSSRRNLHISTATKINSIDEQCCFVPRGANQKRYFGAVGQRSFCQQEKERWADLSYEQMNALIQSRDILLIDVREPKEIETWGKIQDSINIPLSQVKAALQLAAEEFVERFKHEKPQKHDTKLVFYGLCEVKSCAALEIAHKLGYKKARHFPGGFEEWAKRQSHKKTSVSGSS